MAKERAVCPHCGALQRVGDSLCDLCGSSMREDPNGTQLPPDSESQPAAPGPDKPAPAVGPVEGPVPEVPISRPAGFCTSCGAPYLDGARFCGNCGRKLVRVPPPTLAANVVESKSSDTAGNRAASDREIGRQVVIVVGAGILLVVGLFFITIASKTLNVDTATQTAAPVTVQPEPLPPEAAATAARLQNEIAGSSGNERRARRIELIEFYLGQSRMDLAAAVQDSIARETRTEIDWVRAGNLYYDWMEGVEEEARTVYAKKAIEAYSEALAINPDNHDVRTDMAIAYMYDPDNPMQAITQTNQVLADSPDHVQANFNKGIMLLRISRFDEAEKQFDRVKSIISDSTNPIYQRAEAALQAVAQLREQ